jgi:hypothetical protein
MTKENSKSPIFDDLVISLKIRFSVIPAKAGIHPAEGGTAFAGVTAFPTFYKIIVFAKGN